MVKKYVLLFVLLISCFASAQLAPPGCKIYEVIDDNNDGFTEFDIQYYVETYFRNIALIEQGYDLSGYQLLLYPSELDYDNNTNVIVGPTYTNIVANEQFCWLKYIYTGSGPEYPIADLMYYSTCQTLIALPSSGDADNDGVINTLEDLNNNNITTDDDTDGDGAANYRDTDDDGDGILTANEDTNNNGNYLDDDANTNGIPDYLDSATLAITTNNINSFLVTPNPVSSASINITFGQRQEFGWFIADISGKVILKSQTQTGQTIDVSGLKAGIYFITVEVKSTTATKKIIIL